MNITNYCDTSGDKFEKDFDLLVKHGYINLKSLSSYLDVHVQSGDASIVHEKIQLFKFTVIAHRLKEDSLTVASMIKEYKDQIGI